MKIIIKENRLEMLFAEFLNNWVGSRDWIEFDGYIVLEDPHKDPENNVDMEYDGENGRLWVRYELISILIDLFPTDFDETFEYVGKYFEKKFGVKVNEVV